MFSCRLRSHFVRLSKKHYSPFDFCVNAHATRTITTKNVNVNDSIVFLDVTIIGGGISGLASIQRLRNDGFTVNAIESGDDIGGTWYWNRYPGAVCDVPSMEYSYEFDSQLQQDYNWKLKYSTQAQILSYLNHVTDKHNLRKHIHFQQTVEKCTFSESNLNWIIETNTGHKYVSKILILATGCLSLPNKPKYDGLDQYQGYLYYTSKWPDNAVDFSDKNVAIIGTGSTGIQCIPKIAETAKHLTVYQRTAQYVCPLRNKELTFEEQQTIKDNYNEYIRNACNTGFAINLPVNDKLFDDIYMTEDEYENEILSRWNDEGGVSILLSCVDQTVNINADISLAKFIRKRIHDIVKDKKIADALCPTDNQLYACKRALFGTNYFETYNRDNVSLVSISPTRDNGTPIKSITSSGIITSDNIERECDVLIFATGFDALTGAALNINIRGVNNETIQECWKDGPKTYLGLQTAGFPNMFTICGPHSPSVFTNMVRSIEQHVNWISDLIVYMKNNNLDCVQPTIKAQDEWVQFNDFIAKQTLWGSSSCDSWYFGSNVDGKKRHFLPCLMGFDKYSEKCDNVAKENYEGFDFDLQLKEK